MTLGDALSNTLPFRKSQREDKRASRERERQVQRFIADRQPPPTPQELDELTRKATAGVDKDEILAEINAHLEQRKAKAVPRARNSA